MTHPADVPGRTVRPARVAIIPSAASRGDRVQEAGDHPWPLGAVSAASMRATGWRPTPLREFVLKVHQRCNLACDYCYVYTMADQSWRERPTVMPPRVWRAAAARIGEHARIHRLPHVRVILHGGEPLLTGTQLLTDIAGAVRHAAPSGTTVHVGMQTNGALLDERRLAELREHRIKVAVSVDGGRADHDRHRRYADGRGSYAQVDTALRLLSAPDYRSSFAGLLCTIDPRTDPVACYRSLLAVGPPSVDLLLPHANWQTGVAPAAFGPWLVRCFDEYYDEPVKPTVIRLFDEIINLHLGGASWSEHVGLSPAAVAVVESDGAIEQTDALRSAYPGAASTGRSVLHDTFDAVLEHPGIVARQIGLAALCSTCRDCRIRHICGGGHYAHRFRPGSGFLNPSVYCEDLQILIDHVGQRIEADLRSRTGANHATR